MNGQVNIHDEKTTVGRLTPTGDLKPVDWTWNGSQRPTRKTVDLEKRCKAARRSSRSWARKDMMRYETDQFKTVFRTRCKSFLQQNDVFVNDVLHA